MLKTHTKKTFLLELAFCRTTGCLVCSLYDNKGTFPRILLFSEMRKEIFYNFHWIFLMFSQLCWRSHKYLFLNLLFLTSEVMLLLTSQALVNELCMFVPNAEICIWRVGWRWPGTPVRFGTLTCVKLGDVIPLKDERFPHLCVSVRQTQVCHVRVLRPQVCAAPRGSTQTHSPSHWIITSVQSLTPALCSSPASFFLLMYSVCHTSCTLIRILSDFMQIRGL